ncbi:MAG: hypothetical protein LBI33_00345 [Propionibacteriaceae bacterium]|nr:hypothetical protein [Propionibacteriaceae bacterium]
MYAETAARDHVVAFRWWVDRPGAEVSLAEAELRDLAILRDAIEDAITRHAREVATFEGVSWTAVAAALSITPESARRRYDA